MTAADLQHQYFDLLMASQHWPADRLREYQRDQLARLLHHVQRNVPFYEHRLDAIRRPGGEIDWHRWSDIPLVTRRDLRGHRAAMQALRLPPGHGPTGVVHTSGSTGLHVSITRNARTVLAENAARWRGQIWSGIDWNKHVCSRQVTDHEKAAWPDEKLSTLWGPPWLKSTGRAWQLYLADTAQRLFDFMRAHDCAYLNVGAKSAHAWAVEAERLGIDLHIDAILAQGEGVDAGDHDACRRVFGARVIEHYSSKEMGQGAHQCELGTLHINEEGLLLEIVDDQGRPCPAGVVGRVIVTPLYATAQPLIRYEQGDLAAFGAPCACGRAARTIAKVVGRIAAIFRHPDGRATSRLIPDEARDYLGHDMMQIAQTGPTRFEIRYVPVDPARPVDAEGFARLFRQEYFDDAEIVLKPVERIAPGPSGKIALYLNEYDSPR